MERWQDYLKKDSINWLLASNPWTRYRTLTDLLNRTETDSEVIEAKQELLDNNRIRDLIQTTAKWFPEKPKRHDDAKMSHYKLRMLADFGLTIEYKPIKDIVLKAKAHQDDILFAIRQDIPDKSKNNETPQAAWNALPCDSPLMTYILLALGDDGKDVMDTVDFFKDQWNKKEGWFCNLFFVRSQYKKLQVGCPMAGLMSLEIFSLFDEKNNLEYIENCYHPLKFHREYGKSLYYFGRSKRFWTLKYPYVWYNALYIGDVLSRFSLFKDEELLKDIIDWIINSQDSEGRFRPTSMFREYKEWGFANKKEPSPWITFLAYRILKRWHEHSTID